MRLRIREMLLVGVFESERDEKFRVVPAAFDQIKQLLLQPLNDHFTIEQDRVGASKLWLVIIKNSCK